MNGNENRPDFEGPKFSQQDMQDAVRRMKETHPDQFAPQDKNQIKAEQERQIKAAQESVGESKRFQKDPNAPISGLEAPVQIMDSQQLKAAANQEQGKLETLRNRLTQLFKRKS